MSSNISIKNISFSYPSHPVLKRVNFNVNPGEILGIVGPNGSGKSTLLKNISNYLKPHEGEIYFRNDPLSKITRNKLARDVAVVPQSSAQTFNFTVYELVAMGRTPYQGKFRGADEEDKKIIEDSMKETNCWNLRDRYFMELSGGEKQRIILARALTQTPQILLLDEPTTFLDIGYQKELMDLLIKLNGKRNLTVIMVLHDLNLAAQYCHRIVLLKDGYIYSMGDPWKVLTRENISEVYGTHVVVTKNPTGNYPLINIMPHEKIQDKEAKLLEETAIFLISGGGTGETLLEFLAENGAKVCCGVLNIGDSDWEKAKELGGDIVEEEPFSPIKKDNIEKAKEYVEKSTALVLGSLPFGHGNLPNLDLINHALKYEIPVLFYKIDENRVNDYTGDKAKNILKDIKDKVIIVNDLNELLSELTKKVNKKNCI